MQEQQQQQQDAFLLVLTILQENTEKPNEGQNSHIEIILTNPYLLPEIAAVKRLQGKRMPGTFNCTRNILSAGVL